MLSGETGECSFPPKQKNQPAHEIVPEVQEEEKVNKDGQDDKDPPQDSASDHNDMSQDKNKSPMLEESIQTKTKTDNMQAKLDPENDKEAGVSAMDLKQIEEELQKEKAKIDDQADDSKD